MFTPITFARRSTLAFIAASFLPAQAAETADTLRATVDAAIRPLMSQYDVPGMAVAVTLNGEVRFFNYGVASRETQTPVTEATLFELGSVSKTFTATLASHALSQGKLLLSDHPSRYIPALKGSAIDKASVLNLGTYTAGGLPLQFPETVENSGDLTGYYQQWKPDAAPGKQRRYSNPSLGLFGHVTALALKQDFADAMETQLLSPLGLAHTYVRVPEQTMPSYAWGYNKANQAVRANPGGFAAETYGIKSTSADMIRYLQANIDPSALSATMQQAVTGTHVRYFKVGPMVQGLGWEQYPYPVTLKQLQAGNSEAMIWDPNPARQLASPAIPKGPTLFNKTGSTGGFGAYAAFVPARKIGIVMLANKNYPIPARIKAAHAILMQLEPAMK